MFKSIGVFIAALALSFGLSARTLGTAISPSGAWVGLTDEACSLEVVKTMVPKQLHEHLFRAQMQLGKQSFEACYLTKDDEVLLIFDDGDAVLVPRSVFKEGKVL